MSSPSDQKCAICGKQVQARFAPFCSKRCADIDLGRWLKGSYSVPGTPAEDAAQPGGEDAPEE